MGKSKELYMMSEPTTPQQQLEIKYYTQYINHYQRPKVEEKKTKQVSR